MNGISFSSTLSIPEERRLFCTLKRGLRWRRRGVKPELVRQGRDAEARIIKATLPLVDEIAEKFFQKNHRHLVDIDDLRSAGHEGLMTAVRRFHGAHRTRFSTYAAWWIRDAVCKAVREVRWMVGIPSQIHRQVTKVQKATHYLQKLHGRPPNTDEIAVYLGVSSNMIPFLLAWTAPQCISIETPLTENGKYKIGDLIEDRSISPPNMSAELTILHDGFGHMLAHLSRRERSVIEGRFGLDGNGEQTQKEIGKRLLITKQAVQAIEEKALRKLRTAMHVEPSSRQSARGSSLSRRSRDPEVKLHVLKH